MDIRVQTTISAPPSEVWELLSDVRHWPDWLPTVDEVTPTDPDTTYAPGATFVVRQPRMPKATWAMTEWQPGDHFTWRSRGAGLTTVGTHQLRDLGDGRTQVTLGIDWSGVLAPLVRLALGRRGREYVETEGATLRERLESA